MHTPLALKRSALAMQRDDSPAKVDNYACHVLRRELLLTHKQTYLV